MANVANTVRRMGDAYFMAITTFGVSSDIVITCDLLRNVKCSSVIQAFGNFISAQPQLRYRRVYAGKVWGWAPPEDNSWQRIWTELSAEIESEGEVSPKTGADHLPFRLIACSEKQIIFSMDHTFANGRAALYWVELFFQTLSSEDRGEDAGENPGKVVDSRAVVGSSSGILSAIKYLWSSTQLRRRIMKGKKDIRWPLVSINHQHPLVHWVGRFAWSEPEVQERLLCHAGAGETFTEVLTRLLLEHTFRHCDELGGVGIDVVADMHEALNVPMCAVGNYTAPLMGYIDGSYDVGKQVQSLFVRLRSGMPVGVCKVFELMAPSLSRMVSWLRTDLKKVIKGYGAPMMDNIFTMSNLGVVNGPFSRDWMCAVSIRACTHSIYVSATTINKSTVFEVTYPIGIFDSEQVDRVILEFFEPNRLLKNPDSATIAFKTEQVI